MSGLFSLLFHTGVFLYLWLFINPSLQVPVQETAFQTGYRFFTEYAGYPGGIADYCSLFLMQFFRSPIAGAGIITLLIALISFSSRRLVRALHPKAGYLHLHLFPAVLIAALHANYGHPLSATLGLALLLVLVNPYARYALSGNTTLRGICFFSISLLLYVCIGATYFLFAVMALLLELFIGRRYLLSAGMLVAAALMPLCAQQFLFLVSLKQAYLHPLPLGLQGYAVPFLPHLLYGFFPLLVPVLLKLRGQAPAEGAPVSGRLFSITSMMASMAAVIVFAVGLLPASGDRARRASLTICQSSMNGEWSAVLAQAARVRLHNPLVSCAVGQALYFTGRLSTDLFRYPWPGNAGGLFLIPHDQQAGKGMESFVYDFRSDLYFRLGLVSLAEQWAYESISVRGETPWTLRRLARIHALKGERAACCACLGALEKMPLERKWVRSFREALHNGTVITGDDELREISASMPVADFIVQSMGKPFIDLERQLERAGNARMASDYLLASYLLNGEVGKVLSFVAEKGKQGFYGIPRLYQEAVLLGLSFEKDRDSNLYSRMDQQIIDDFNDFNRVMEHYAGDAGKKFDILSKRFGSTFWFYYLYTLQKEATGP
ncbi:MAG: hypothetical protein JW768_14710 [Chitinispirillaceae bacterium]|nr:hypothetical protein [Chitinispirillaceae bacterium]